jgi:N-acetylglucosamine kinase-like BadF-type ATPase
VSRLLLGVDGGATKTIALIVDISGEVLGAGRAGSSDIHGETPPDQAVDNIAASVHEALSAAEASTSDLGACVFGLCGADWPEDEAYYAGGLRSRLSLDDAPIVTNDAFNSLRAGTDDGIGVAIVLGTGGAIAARGRDGASWFSGERMERIGALELGRVIFDSLVRAEYADGPRPVFEQSALQIFGLDSVEALVYAITRTGGAGYRSVARLAPALLDAAHDGDASSRQIVQDQSRRLAGYVRSAGLRVGLREAERTVVLAGGLLRSRGSLVREEIEAELPDYSVSISRLEPAHGAVLMAADQAGIRLPTQRLVGSGPPSGFFSTAETS